MREKLAKGGYGLVLAGLSLVLLPLVLAGCPRGNGDDPVIVPVERVEIHVDGVSATTGSVAVNGTLTLTAVVVPATATNQNVTWAVTAGTGTVTYTAASLTANELTVTGATAGTVTITLNAAGGGTSATLELEVTELPVVVPVERVEIHVGGVSATMGSVAVGYTLALTAVVVPATATNQNVTWAVTAGTGTVTYTAASLTANELTVTGATAGTVTITLNAVGGGTPATLELEVTELPPPCCAPGCDCDGDCGTAGCDCEDVPPIVLVGAPGTVDRTGVDIVLGEAVAGMESLLAVGHFAAVGAAEMATRDGYVFAYDIANNSSGIQILPPGAITMTAGYRYLLRATGRTTGTVANSRLELHYLDGGAGGNLGNDNAVHTGSIPTSFNMEWTLTADNATRGLRIAPNGWGWDTAGGAPTPAEQFIVRFADFAFSIDDLIIFREPIIIDNQAIRFNLADPAGVFQTTGAIAETGLTPNGTASAAVHTATYGAFTNRNFLYISGRTQNYHGLNVAGVNAGDIIRVTGRRGANWNAPPDGGQIHFMEGGSGNIPMGAVATVGTTFTLTGTVSAGSTSFRIAVNAFNAPAGFVHPSFYIYSIIVGTDLDQPAAIPADTVDIEATENFWPVPVLQTGTGSVTITFNPLANPLEQIAVNVPEDGLDGFGVTFALPAGFANPRWYRNAAPIDGATTATLTLDDTFDATPGRRHLVTFRADRGGRTYSQIVAITVVSAVTP